MSLPEYEDEKAIDAEDDDDDDDDEDEDDGEDDDDDEDDDDEVDSKPMMTKMTAKWIVMADGQGK